MPIDGGRIRELLQERGLNARRFAAIHGLDYPSVVNTLNGRRGISPRMLVALAEEGVDIRDILSSTGRTDPAAFWA